MDAAQALADLTEISTQIEGAVLSEEGGRVVASTFGEGEKGERVARAAAELLRAAEEARGEAGERLTQIEAAVGGGSVFVVRDDRHVVAAVTGTQPTVGLIFYDLKTCLRLVGDERGDAKPKRASRKKAEDDKAAKDGEGGDA